MDTRSKILTAGAASAAPWPAFDRPLAVATGYFDVLRAADARELAEVRQRSGAKSLVVVVLRLSGEVLPLRARAELVAALRMVDYVVTADLEDVGELVGTLKPDELVRMEAACAARSRGLIEHVHQRQTR